MKRLKGKVTEEELLKNGCKKKLWNLGRFLVYSSKTYTYIVNRSKNGEMRVLTSYDTPQLELEE